jgi:CheY-like chemotaxis protein
MRVLIATGDVFAAASIKVTLAKAKLICHTTELGQDALQMAEAYDYDIILLDLTRPDIEDYEVLRRLRAAEAATRAAEERTVGRAHLPLSQTAPPLSQIERRLARGPEDVRDQRVGRCRAPGIRHRPEVRSISSPVEMRFEDAVTEDGGPFHLPRPEPARSLYGCTTARCHE